MMKRVLIALSMLCFALSVQAAELSKYTANKVQKAQQLAQEEKVAEAIAVLKDLDSSRAYDKAFVARMLGVFYWQADKIQSAIQQLDYAVDSGLLQDEQAWVTRRMLADLLLNDQQFSKALPHYYQLVKSLPKEKKEDELWLRIAQSHYQLAEWEKVLSALQQYDRFHQVDTVPPLSLKLGAQMLLKRWKSAVPTLERLIVLQPNKVNWWRQLVGLQIRLSRNKAALSSLALAKLQGVELSQQDLRLLAQLYAQCGIPERAALQISELEKSQSDVKLLVEQATYWQMAKEWDKAIEVWRLATSFKEKYHWNLAQLLVQEGHYKQALTSLDKVKAKDKKSAVALAKTRVFYKLNNLESALIQAKRAENLKPSQEAKGWIKYLTQLRKMESEEVVL